MTIRQIAATVQGGMVDAHALREVLVLLSGLEGDVTITVTPGAVAKAAAKPRAVRTHSGHVPGFCDWICFPKRLQQQYAACSGHDVSTPERRAEVEASVARWAAQVRLDWRGRPISESLWAFWNARWRELGMEGGHAVPVASTTPVVTRLARLGVRT